MLVEVKLEMDDIVLEERDKNMTYLVKIHESNVKHELL